MSYMTPGNPKRRLTGLFMVIIFVVSLFTIRLVDLQIIQAEAINKVSFAIPQELFNVHSKE